MHRLSVSKLVALILISQVMCLAVLGSAIWELNLFHSTVTNGLERAAEGPPPESITKPGSIAGYEFRAPRFLGKSGLVSDCLSMQIRARINRELGVAEPLKVEDCRPEYDAE